VSRSGSFPASTIALLALAALVRIAAAWHWSGNLDDDRDVYRALALGIVEGRGFSSPGSTVPTAYRPPLYPLLLAATSGAYSTFAVAALNVVFGTATVGFVLAAARQLRMPQRAAAFAGLITAIDPLLVYYTSFPMTETLCTCLLTACLWTALRMQATTGTSQLRWGAICGVLLGLTALCRPTVWACAVVMFAVWAWSLWRRSHRVGENANPQAMSDDVTTRSGAVRVTAIVTLLLAAVLTVAPWGLRNWRVFDRPIITTTHGGYTVLLGNNPAYYREVVRQRLGVVWDGSHGAGQAAWAAELNREMIAAGLFGEVERDQWMSAQARRAIVAEPESFVRACLRRFLHFWSLRPSVRVDGSTPRIFDLGVAVYYCLTFALAACGFARIVSGRVNRALWVTPVLLIAGFVAVHLVYWTDARMRAPVTPEIALLASIAWTSIHAVRRRNERRVG